MERRGLLSRPALLLALVMVTSACMEVTYELDVVDDDNARTTVEILLDVDLGLEGEQFESEPADREQLCELYQSWDGVIDTAGMEFETIDDGRWCGARFTLESADAIRVFDELYALDEPATRGSGEVWEFELTVPPLTEDDVSDPFANLEDPLDGASSTYRVRLPGRQLDHNGTIDDEGFVVWTFDPTDGASMFLRTGPGERIVAGDDSVPWWLIAATAIAVAALGVSLVNVVRTRGAVSPEPDDPHQD